MRIVINLGVPSYEMRYATLGDWTTDADGNLRIEVAASNEDDMLLTEDAQFLVALHELVESWLCRNAGVTQHQVDEWDMAHQEDCNANNTEPGDMPGCPYRKHHRCAMIVEHLLAHELGMVGYGTVK